MDSQGQIKRISEQIGFLEKKIDSILEELRNRGGARPFGGGQGGPRNFSRDRGSFRGGNGGSNGRPPRQEGGNTRYAGQGPRRYNSARPFGNDDNRGNFSGGNRPEGMRGNRPNNGGPRRPHQQGPNQHQNHSAPAAPQQQSAAPESGSEE